MDVLQHELDEVRDMWNTHLIVHRRNENQVYGIPDELYHIPEIQGTYTLLVEGNTYRICNVIYCNPRFKFTA